MVMNATNLEGVAWAAINKKNVNKLCLNYYNRNTDPLRGFSTSACNSFELANCAG